MKRFKTSFLINFIGLASGLACVLFIYLWINDELSFDRFHKNDSQLYQVMELSKENDQMVVHDGTQGLLASSMVKDLLDIEYASPVFLAEKMGMKMDLMLPGKSMKGKGGFVGADFFKMFSFPLLEGSASQVMKDKNSIVISDAYAKSFFGSSQLAMGKTMEYEMFGNKFTAQVTGVFAELSPKGSLHFDFLMTHEKLISEIWTNGQNWGNTGPVTYVQLKKNVDPGQFNTRIKSYLEKYGEKEFTLFVRSFGDAYLHGTYVNGIQSGGRIEYVKMFGVIGLIILIVACINFMNLSTARASRRMKEVGIKKAIGSSRKALVFQFMTEAILVVVISMLAACLVVALLLPAFNHLTGKTMVFGLNTKMALTLAGIAAITGILSGSYPAFYLSGFNPVAVLKGRPKNSFSELLARKGLVVFQFTVSLVLVISVLVVYRQMEFVQSKDLGYDRSATISFDKSGPIEKNTDQFINELKQMPGIVNASAIQQKFAQKGNGSSTYGINWPGKDPKAMIDIAVRAVDYDLIETLGMKMVAGRSFSRSFGADSLSLIFNEAAIRIMNLKDPVGTKVNMWGKDKTIVGVVKDFHISSLHEVIEPTVMMYEPGNTSFVITKIRPENQRQTISKIETLFKKWNPGGVFEYSFLDEESQAQYISEQRVSVLSRYFAGLGILIMCLGLFGLAAFNAEMRTKEIGIRKVLGASTQAVVYLLSKDFFKLVLIAVLVSFPIAWVVMNNWLAGFVYRVKLDGGVFMVALVAILLITALTISFQSIKAALRNPTKSLKGE